MPTLGDIPTFHQKVPSLNTIYPSAGLVIGITFAVEGPVGFVGPQKRLGRRKTLYGRNEIFHSNSLLLTHHLFPCPNECILNDFFVEYG
jgi:hypothetical protein